MAKTVDFVEVTINGGATYRLVPKASVDGFKKKGYKTAAEIKAAKKASKAGNKPPANDPVPETAGDTAAE